MSSSSNKNNITKTGGFDDDKPKVLDFGMKAGINKIGRCLITLSTFMAVTGFQSVTMQCLSVWLSFCPQSYLHKETTF